MADEQVGLRKEEPRELPAWTKLFSGFKVALDPKKLLLAALGIVAMSFGWWLLSVIFFDIFGSKTPPKWDDYKNQEGKLEDNWRDFNVARIRWNLRYEMAGPAPASPAQAFTRDAADLASSPEEYAAIEHEKNKIQNETSKRTGKIYLGHSTDWAQYWLEVGKVPGEGGGKDVPEYTIPFTASPEYLEKLKAEMSETTSKVRAEEIVLDLTDPKTVTAKVKTIPISKLPPEKAERFAKDLRESKSLSDIQQEIRNKQRENPEVTRKALQLVAAADVQYKPYGRLRSWPWFENRGPNPHLLVTGNALGTGQEGIRSVPWERGEFLGWFASDQLPVLVEPLVKFLRPIAYLFDPASGGWNRIYLLLVIVWTLAVWALFGGAITRIAAVQLARPNEKVGMTDAVRFTWARYRSYFSAPLFPLLFILVLTVFLIVFGFVEEFTWFFGDIFIAGLFWPIVLLVGLIMAVVLVGLVGWPLMYSTISTEGSDSFDAISRSYSYVYQAPWQYLWYAFIALVYGAVLIFFVGLMGSLMVYLGKWGVSQTPGPSDRNPTYLFAYAPTSYGWRDLLLHKEPHTQTVEVVHNNGRVGRELRLDPEYYAKEVTWNNRVGAFLVSIWIYLLFVMVVGFGYSYFWTASTIIYLLMRRKVDDTELDEVHLEEEEFEEPAPRPAAVPATTAAPVPPTGGRTMLDAPTIKPSSVPVTPAVVTASPPSPPPVSAAPKTQLAPGAGEASPPPVSAAPKTQLAPMSPEPIVEGKDGPATSGTAEPPHGGSEGGTTPPAGGPPHEEGRP